MSSQVKHVLRLDIYLKKGTIKIVYRKYLQNYFFCINLIAIGTHCMFGFLDVNGLAMEASAFDKDMPA